MDLESAAIKLLQEIDDHYSLSLSERASAKRIVRNHLMATFQLGQVSQQPCPGIGRVGTGGTSL